MWIGYMTAPQSDNKDHGKETGNTVLIDGNHGMGHVIAYRAMEKAISMARDANIGMVGVRNSTPFGITGFYLTWQ